MKISVIVPCRNERRYIGAFLDSVLAQDIEEGDEIEILVADGRSDDGTREILRQYMEIHPRVRMIDNPAQIVSSGLNAAIAAAGGEVIARMDVHTSYANNYLRECIRTLNTTGADNVGGPWVAEGRGWMGQAIAAAVRSRFCTGGGKAHDPEYEGEVDTVYLGCWNRQVFERIGYFDPALVRNQDDEFNFRLRRSGGIIWQSPRIRSSYTPRESISALFRQYLQYGFWKVAVMRKHRGLASWRHAVPVFFVCSLLLESTLILAAALTGLQTTAIAIEALLVVELGIYIAACLAAATSFHRSLNRRALFVLPAVIAAYHFSDGTGFLIGLFSRPPVQTAGTGPSRYFTALTR